jgi:hypothetical protein
LDATGTTAALEVAGKSGGRVGPDFYARAVLGCVSSGGWGEGEGGWERGGGVTDALCMEML